MNKKKHSQKIKNRLRELANLIAEHNTHYHQNDKPLISDGEYDKLVIENLNLEKKYPNLILKKGPNDIVGGFQFQITDYPNYGLFIDVQPTERIPEQFQIQFNEQQDGTVIVVGFDLALAGIQTGSGPILNLTYQLSLQILQH